MERRAGYGGRKRRRRSVYSDLRRQPVHAGGSVPQSAKRGARKYLLAGEVAVLLRDAAAVGIDTGARNAVRQRYMSRMREARTEAPQAGTMPKLPLLDSMSE